MSDAETRYTITVGFAAEAGVGSLSARVLLHLCSLAFIGIAIRVLGLDGFGVYRIVLQVLSVELW